MFSAVDMHIDGGLNSCENAYIIYTGIFMFISLFLWSLNFGYATAVFLALRTVKHPIKPALLPTDLEVIPSFS